MNDLLLFEQRIKENTRTLNKYKRDILYRWKVMGVIVVLMWVLCRLFNTNILLHVIFYVCLSVFLVLIAVSLRSGRVFSIDQYREDLKASLMVYNLNIDAGLRFTDRVPKQISCLLAQHARDNQK